MSSAEEYTFAPGQKRSLWRNRDYMLLWSGQTVSAIGSSASQIAFPLLILFLTGSAAQAGVAGGLQLVPYLFLSLPVGVLIDRWDRKRVMIVAESIRAINMASVPTMLAFGHLWVAQLYIVALVEGSAFVFFNIAEVACLPRVVSREQLPDATAQNQMMYMFATLAGPPLGGFLYQVVGKVMPFLADALSYAVSMVSLFFIRTEFQGVRPLSRPRLGPEIAEGLRWLWNQRVLRVTAIVMSVSTLVNAGGFLLLIVLARNLSVSPAGIGLILSIASIGGLGGAVLAPRLQRRFSFGQVVIVEPLGSGGSHPAVCVSPQCSGAYRLHGGVVHYLPGGEHRHSQLPAGPHPGRVAGASKQRLSIGPLRTGSRRAGAHWRGDPDHRSSPRSLRHGRRQRSSGPGRHPEHPDSPRTAG